MNLIIKQAFLLLNTYVFILICIISNLDKHFDIIKKRDLTFSPILAWPLWILTTLGFSFWIGPKMIFPFMAFTFVGSMVVYLYMDAVIDQWNFRKGKRVNDNTFLASQRWRVIISGTIGAPIALIYPVYFLFSGN